MKIVLATSNEHKVKEINEIVKDTGIEFILPPQGFDPEENGTTFEENSYSDSLTNKSYNQTDDGHFFYTNAIHSYDVIKTKGVTKLEFRFTTNE